MWASMCTLSMQEESFIYNHYCVHIGQFPCISLLISYFLRSTLLSREHVLVVKEENNKYNFSVEKVILKYTHMYNNLKYLQDLMFYNPVVKSPFYVVSKEQDKNSGVGNLWWNLVELWVMVIGTICLLENGKKSEIFSTHKIFFICNPPFLTDISMYKTSSRYMNWLAEGIG